jgi:hypothetical protein
MYLKDVPSREAAMRESQTPATPPAAPCQQSATSTQPADGGRSHSINGSSIAQVTEGCLTVVATGPGGGAGVVQVA